MPIYKTPQAKLDEIQQIYAARRASRPEPTLANIEAVTTEHDQYLLQYRQRVFLVPPVPYRQGMWLMALDQELRRIRKSPMSQEMATHGIAVVAEILQIFHTLIRPVFRFDRWFWRFRDNPFINADEAEIDVLLSFFCSARTKYNVRATPMKMRPQFLSQIWPLRRPPLPIGLARGWDKMETPVAGDTI